MTMSTQGIAEVVVQDDVLESLESLIQRRLGGRIRDFHVVARDRGIILQGRTATYHMKQLAQHAAMELCDLPILANDIEVR
jgi:hypothetical protein